MKVKLVCLTLMLLLGGCSSVRWKQDGPLENGIEEMGEFIVEEVFNLPEGSVEIELSAENS